MKIGIDIHASRGAKTGLGVYTDNLLHALADFKERHQFFNYAASDSAHWNTFRRLYWENFELPKLAKKDKIEILHVPAFSPPFRKFSKLVVTVHDLIGVIFPNQRGLPSRWYWGSWLPFTIRRADCIITDSENTKKDVLRHLAVPEKKIRVVYPSGHEGFSSHVNGTALESLKKNLGVREKYFLCVGTIEPRKNLLRVIQAYARFMRKKRSPSYQLLVVGSKEFAHGKAFLEIMNSASVNTNGIIFTGYLEHEDLNRLYCGAEAFLFPSLYEGFGIPILEAMACGVPVLASDRSSLPEVGGDAVYSVNPINVDEITEGMSRLADDTTLRRELIEKGSRQIGKFSWKKTAREIVQVYESLA